VAVAFPFPLLSVPKLAAPLPPLQQQATVPPTSVTFPSLPLHSHVFICWKTGKSLRSKTILIIVGHATTLVYDIDYVRIEDLSLPIVDIVPSNMNGMPGGWYGNMHLNGWLGWMGRGLISSDGNS
jgi:hypothetical protein